jgi:hypothetical protein
MTRICEIFRDFGNLKDIFNIKQMLTLLETPAWKSETPLAFYLTPLADSLKDVRDCLLKMHQEGPLHCKYVIENNEELMKKTIEMIKKDVIAQWLAGDELKQDQFKFIYQTMRIMYMSALKPLLLADDKRVIETILPNLVAFRTIRQGKDIMVRKKVDAKREQERIERMTKTGGSMMTMGGTQSALRGTQDFGRSTSPVKNASPTRPSPQKQPSMAMDKKSEKEQAALLSLQQYEQRQAELEAERKEIQKYGRMLVWEGYFHPSKTDQWFSASEKLRHINAHVI